MSPSPKKVCVDLLEEEMLRPKKRPRLLDVYSTLLRLAQCFVATTRQVDEMSNEVYGNGVPGGLKLQVSQLCNDMAEVKKYMKESSQIKYGRRTEDEGDDKDTFATAVKWFVDKVLPTLVTAGMLGMTNLILFLIALSRGWIAIP